MTTYVVKTQAEYDSAIKDLAGKHGLIEIRSDRGVWITVGSESDSATVQASDSATVRASDSATVQASDSATVRAWGSATVQASDSATVEAWDSATVEAWDSATVRASDSATVRASGSATVRASGSATVEAWDSATVHSHNRSKTTASPHVAVHLHSAAATVEGGVIIDVTNITSSATGWLEHHGIHVEDGTATLYKAVRDDLHSYHGFHYPIGETVACTDWRDVDSCGNGLHLSPRPVHARSYYPSATRFLACKVQVEDIRVLTDGGAPKCKVPSLTVLHMVDIDGEPLTEAEVTA